METIGLNGALWFLSAFGLENEAAHKRFKYEAGNEATTGHDPPTILLKFAHFGRTARLPAETGPAKTQLSSSTTCETLADSKFKR